MVFSSEKGSTKSGGFTSRLFNSLRPKASRNKLGTEHDAGESVHLKAESDAGSAVTTLRSKASRNKLKKEPPRRPMTANPKGKGISHAGQNFRPTGRSFDYAIDEQTGERVDHTALLHGLAHMGSFDSMHEAYGLDNPDRPPGEPAIASLSSSIWENIVGYLSLSDAASLAFSNKTLLNRLGRDSWWSDLGNGTSPFSPEWAAINGEFESYDSFDTVKGRAISGTFEAQFGVTLPGQRILSLNPRNEMKGEDGHNWY
ncbi:hypothetical protein DID88_002507 [Monilinia fructigena]|uniref:F-box domain-containing protein n=1 Tax=Monilinia fructigena TaxID=38457 RepID=A0A395IQZ3_9HELO|nr:hypothetical protein DID88_002507 [Monilinia fructigena]